jgi:Protein of unknown function (DUF3631)
MKSMPKGPERRAHTSCPADANVLFDIKEPSSALSSDIATALPGSEKVLDSPRVEVTPEESARRVMVEATRLASLAPGEWRLWIDRSAERLRIPRATLQDLIVAIIKNAEKKARDAETAARRQELAVRREQERKQREQERIDKRTEHKRKEKEKAFESLISLPNELQESRLGELAKRLDEDVAVIRDHFTAFVGMQSWAASTDSWNVELWPDPVETQALIQKISAKIRKYIVLRPEAVIATALWTMTAWAHEGATHSPILAAISIEPDSGKSTLLGVLRFLVPKPFVSVEPTGPSVYRTVDREHPTLIIDEADDLFCRKSDLRAIVNAGWSRGTRIPRQGRWYDPFCPKILGILGKTKLPRTIASRSIILKMWPKRPDEKADDFAYADDAEFSTIRRKLARWAADNVRIIKDLKPPQPSDFNNRLNANWKLLLQIAQHAGGGWPEQARRSAIYLSRAPYEPSIGVQLLAALRAMFSKNRTEITSEQVVQELVADPDSPWHEYCGRGPITKNQVAALLRDYDIRPVVLHPTKRADFSRHGYRAAHFDDAFARFLPHGPNIRTLKSGREKM